MDNTIIIIGGLGPQGSLLLHKRLLDLSRLTHNGAPDAYPVILHASLRIPDFIASPKNFHRAQQKLLAACNSLRLEQATAIGIACNTAHLMVPSLNMPKKSFVSMVDAVVDEVVATGKHRIGLMASPHTIVSNMYQKEFTKHGLTTIVPDKTEIKSLDNIIHAIIRNESPADFKDELIRTGKRLQDKGAEILVLGCTELPVVGLLSDLPIIDSIDALARRMLDKHDRNALVDEEKETRKK